MYDRVVEHDIVERLRNPLIERKWKWRHANVKALLAEAADEIERWRSAAKDIQKYEAEFLKSPSMDEFRETYFS